MGKVKHKTKKSAAKRFKVTRNGKLIYTKQGRRHLLTGKSSKRKMHLRGSATLAHCEAKKLIKLLPFA